MGNTKSELDLLKQENARLMARIAELERTVEEKDELMARIMELERYKSDTVNLITENIELKDRITKLEQKQLHDNKSLVNTAPAEIVNSNDTPASDPEQIVSQCDDTPVSDISDDTSNSGNTPSEHILVQSKLPEDNIDYDIAETLDFVETKYKERVSEEIMERIREKKLRDQNLSLDISSSKEVVPEISAEDLCQNTHRKKGAEKIVQLIPHL
jgi:hypothetical protein